MAYINIETKQYPVSEQDIRNEFPNTSFPTPFASEGYEVVFPAPEPTVDNPVLQIARESVPELFTKVNEQTEEEYSFYMQTWEIVDKFVDYTDAEGNIVTKAEQEAAAIAADEKAKKDANQQRASQELLQSDWVENPSVSDTTKVPHLSNFAEFMEYRLALRSIAINPPVAVEEWPIAPIKNWITE